MAPTRKVAAGGFAGAATIVLVWALGAATEVAVPPEVAAAMTTVLTFAVAWWVPEARAKP